MIAELPRADEFSIATVFADLMTRRRSVRQLQGGELSREALARIRDAAGRTPAAFNLPPWRVEIVHGQHEPFWDLVDAAFRGSLEGDRLERYLSRLEGVRSGAGAVLVFEDCAAVDEMRVASRLDHASARAYAEQGLGMVQLAIWLAVVAEGMVTSLQHWEAFIEGAVLGWLRLPPDRYRLVATMPLGQPAVPVPPREDTGRVVQLVPAVEGACRPTS